jgi:hypothetical protein
MPRKPKQTPHLRIRIEPGLLARLERSREKNGRTLTGEIVHRLEQTFIKDDTDELLARQAHLLSEEIKERLAEFYKMQESTAELAARLVRQAEDARQAEDEDARRASASRLAEAAKLLKLLARAEEARLVEDARLLKRAEATEDKD